MDEVNKDEGTGSYLDVASELSSGIEAALRVLAESKPCLSAQTDPVRVSIVDSP